MIVTFHIPLKIVARLDGRATFLYLCPRHPKGSRVGGAHGER